jgi:peptide/nickel transport system permease protein
MQTRMGPAGLMILIGIFIFVVLGSLLLPYDFYKVPQPDEINFIGRPPAWGRPFGETGMLQLDVLTLVANGGRTSLIIGFATAIGSISIGTFVGVIAGFIGGKVDSFLMRLADVFLMIPSLFVILFLARIFQGEGGGGVWSLVIVFVGFGWMGLARLVRGQVLAIREMEFVEAARALGVPGLRIALRHILPNAIGPVVVSAPFIVGGAIVGEAFISYLGFGVNPATPTWGNILSESSKFLQQGNWWWIGFPGLFIVLTSLSVNMIGDTLRSALDPRGRK